jgi:MerR family transcriptional regulator, copper efflux regulator
MPQLTIGKLAKRAGVNLETIRYYERQELLPKPPRSQSGYRAFPTQTIERIRFIKQAQELGFSLKEIKELLALRTEPLASGADVRKKVEAKIADIDEKMKTLRTIKKELVQLRMSCDGTSSIGECPILKSISFERS